MSTPSTPELISGLHAVADRYDAVLCDVWGVVHNGESGFTDAHNALTQFQKTRGPVVLISNAPRPSDAILPQLRALNTPDSAWSAIVTSGDVTRAELRARAPGPAWAIGPDRDQALYDGVGLSFAGPDAAAFISCTGLVDDETETAEAYRAQLTTAAARRIDFICANPDRVVQRGPRLIPCAGALADVYESLGGPVIMAGKPYPPIYKSALAEVERLAGRPVDMTRVLAIGDGLPTDVAGAQRMGLDCLFVTSGIHAVDTQDADGRVNAGRLTAFLDANGATARYAMAELAWGGQGSGLGDRMASKALTLEEIEVGQSAERMNTVTESVIQAFADVSGDHNPVHLDPVFAETTPFKGRIAHGMLSAAYISATIAGDLPGPGAIYIGQTLSFRRPVRIDDTVLTRVTVTAVDTDKARVTLKTECLVGGKTVIDGEAVVMVPRTPGA